MVGQAHTPSVATKPLSWGDEQLLEGRRVTRNARFLSFIQPKSLLTLTFCRKSKETWKKSTIAELPRGFLNPTGCHSSLRHMDVFKKVKKKKKLDPTLSVDFYWVFGGCRTSRRRAASNQCEASCAPPCPALCWLFVLTAGADCSTRLSSVCVYVCLVTH